MHSYCMELFHWKILLCLRKERLHIPTLFVDFFIGALVHSANSGSVHPNIRRVVALVKKTLFLFIC